MALYGFVLCVNTYSGTHMIGLSHILYTSTFALHCAQKDRTDPSVDRSRVRECGTSGHAAAH